jgi:tRNA-methyltransferase O
VEIDTAFGKALEGMAAGQDVVLLTWLHLGHRDVLKVHPRDNPDNPLTGVFATRSPNRPNPIGLHRSACWRSPRPRACASNLWRRWTARRWRTSSRYIAWCGRRLRRTREALPAMPSPPSRSPRPYPRCHRPRHRSHGAWHLGGQVVLRRAWSNRSPASVRRVALRQRRAAGGHRPQFWGCAPGGSAIACTPRSMSRSDPRSRCHKDTSSRLRLGASCCTTYLFLKTQSFTWIRCTPRAKSIIPSFAMPMTGCRCIRMLSARQASSTLPFRISAEVDGRAAADRRSPMKVFG